MNSDTLDNYDEYKNNWKLFVEISVLFARTRKICFKNWIESANPSHLIVPRDQPIGHDAIFQIYTSGGSEQKKESAGGRYFWRRGKVGRTMINGTQSSAFKIEARLCGRSGMPRRASALYLCSSPRSLACRPRKPSLAYNLRVHAILAGFDPEQMSVSPIYCPCGDFWLTTISERGLFFR